VEDPSREVLKGPLSKKPVKNLQTSMKLLLITFAEGVRLVDGQLPCRQGAHNGTGRL